MENPEKYALPDASYGTLLGVFERLGDVIGAPGKKLILGRRRYTTRIGITTHSLTLSKRGVSLRVMERSSTVARARVSFPFHGKTILSYAPGSSAVIIRVLEGVTLIVPIRGISKEGVLYIAYGKVPKAKAPEPPAYPVIRDADVPPMESFSDYGKPYNAGKRHVTKARPSDRNRVLIDPSSPGRQPFYRRNREIITRAKGKHVDVYTDGGLRPEEGHIGSWAFTIVHSEDVAAMEAGTAHGATITRLELLAAVKALHAIAEINPLSATVYTDSQYLRNGAEIWWKGWLQKDGKITPSIKDADLWNELVDTRNRLKAMHVDVTFVWIKGHSGNKWNTFVDQKSKAAMDLAATTGKGEERI